jgi:putative transposase
MLQDRLGLSERRACQIAGQHRSTQRYQPLHRPEDDALRARLREFSRARPRWGYRRAWAVLRDEGWAVNRKRIQRLWRQEGLRVPPKRRKRQRLGTSTVPADRLRAETPNQVWAIDFQFDVTADGRILKLLNIVDEHTREALAIVVDRSIDADRTVATLDQLITERSTAPGFIRCDNGPELTANAIRDWCRFSRSGASYIEPGSPWENPYVESFGGRLRDELLAVEQFDTLLEARVVIEDWRCDYNHHRPHSSLGWQAPAVYAANRTEHQPPQLS